MPKKDNIIYSSEDLIKRIGFLENFIAAIYRDAVVVDKNGNQKVNIEPSELRELIACETELLHLKRKLLGVER